MTISYEHNFGGAANTVIVVEIPTSALHSRTSNDVEVTIDYGGREFRSNKSPEIPPARIKFTTSEDDLADTCRQLLRLIDR